MRFVEKEESREISDPERGFLNLFKRENRIEKVEYNGSTLNHRGRMFARNVIGSVLGITGIGLVAGASGTVILGLNALGVIGAYYFARNVPPIKETNEKYLVDEDEEGEEEYE